MTTTNNRICNHAEFFSKAERDRILEILDRAAATLSPSSAAIDEEKVRLLAAIRREIAAPPTQPTERP